MGSLPRKYFFRQGRNIGAGKISGAVFSIGNYNAGLITVKISAFCGKNIKKE